MNPGQIALDLFFPRKCPFCRTLVEKDALLCAECQRTLPWLTENAAHSSAEFLTACVSPLRYRGAVVQSIHRYKFSGLRNYAPVYGLLMAQCLRDHPQVEFDLISWPPLSRRRLRRRGYDQAGLLARAVGERLCVPVQPLLVKTRDIPAQSGLEEEAARRANVLGAYAMLPGVDVTGKRILLTDDVITSGATLSECARTLLTAGAAQVCAVTLAQAGRQR